MGGHGLQVLDAGVFGIGSEAVLLIVGGAEDIVPEGLDC